MAQSPQFRKKSKTDKANNQGANYYLSQRKFFNKLRVQIRFRLIPKKRCPRP